MENLFKQHWNRKRIVPGAVPSIFPNSSFTSTEPSESPENPGEGQIKEKVCELHFKCNDIENESSMLDTKSGKIVSAPIKYPRLAIGAIPSQFQYYPSNMPSSTLSKENSKIKKRRFKEFSIVKDMQTTSETESQNGVEASIAIKQEPFESVDETPRLDIEKIHRPEDRALSSRNSSPSSSLSSCVAEPVAEKTMSLANPDPPKTEKTTTVARVAGKPARKRKINDGKPDTIAISPNASQAKSCRRSKPSMPSKLPPPAATLKKSTGRTGKANQAESCQRTVPFIHKKKNNKLHPTVETANNSAGGSTLSKNDDNATREMFQSLLHCSGNNSLFDYRTTERHGDLFDVFADLIADKLREMDWDDCAFALRSILDVVFKTAKAQLGSEIKSDISSS